MKIIILSTFTFVSCLTLGQGFKDLNKEHYNNVYALIIGVANYEEAPKLNYSDKDARIVHHMLEETFPSQKDNIDTLINENASQINIVNGVLDMVKSAKEGDLVIFYFSGHGDVVEDILDGEKGYFLAHDASKSRNYYPAGGAVEFSFVNKALTKITDNKAKVWMITDACKSGKVVNEKGAGITMNSLNSQFNNTTKFISCGPKELSYEDESLEQGVFTYYLVRALSGEADKDESAGVLNADEINGFMKLSVRKFTENKQTPKITASDDFENIISTNPEFSKLIKTIDEGSTMDLLASRGNKGDNDGKEKSSALKSFEDLVYNGKLHSKTGFAYEVFKSNSLNATPEDKKAMKELLTQALLDRGQRNTNLFLSGKPMIGKNEDFNTTAKDFELASELLGKEHPMYEQLEARSEFFTAMELVKQGKDLSKAESTLNALVLKYPRAAHLNQGLAMLYIKRSEKNKAEAQLAEAVKKIDTWNKPHNSEAYLNIIAGKLDEATKNIEASKNLGSDDNIYILNAYLHSANFELQNAEAALHEIKKDSEAISEADLLEIEGTINELRGRIKVAQKMYKESLASDANNTELLLRLGNLYKKDGDTITALSYFKQVRRLDKNNQTALANIALLTNEKMAINNQFVDARNINEVLTVVDALEDEKSYGDAISLLNRSIELISWNPDLYYQLAKMQYLNGDEVSSMASVQKALEISPYHFKSIRSLAYMYLHQKKYREAEALIQKHDPYFKESAKYLSLSYQIYRQTNAKNDLYAILERAIQLDSLETDAYKGLYRFHIENAAFDEAKREFNQLIEIGGGHQDSVDYYNLLSKQIKTEIEYRRYEGLESGIQQLVDVDPYDFEMAYFMGLVLYMKGDYDGASKALRPFSKSIQSFTPGVQRTFYNLKAKINLETGHPDLAYRLFGMSGSATNPADHLGLAMAKYEMKKEWEQDFRRAGEPIDYNEDAMKRYAKMAKKAGKANPYGGAEHNRR